MNRSFKLAIAAMAAFSLVAVSCNKPETPTPEPEPEPKPEAPELVNKEMVAAPFGETLNYDLVAEDDWFTEEWTMEPEDDYD